jgi:DNA repair photolyase
LFSEWLQAHHPLRAKHVASMLAQMRGGRAYDPAFGSRMSGTGIFADLLRDRFALACKKNGLGAERVSLRSALRTDLFVRPRNTPQLDLF